MNPSSALATVLVDELVRGRCPRGRAVPGVAVGAAGLRAAGGGPAGPDQAARPGRRALRRLPGPGARQGVRRTRCRWSRRRARPSANLHPAVLEAGHAGVPLVVLSADRPPELRGTGANQTTDQAGFFGAAVRWFHELETPARRTGLNGSWRSVVARAVAAARGDLTGDAGPVHVNVPLRDPLVPTPDPAGEPGWPDDLQGRPGGMAWVQATPAVSRPRGRHPRPPARWSWSVTCARHGMAAEAVELARAAGWPVVAEPFGRYDRTAVVPHGALLLGARVGCRRTCRSRCSSSDGSRWPGRSPRSCGTPAYGSRWSRPTADWVDPSHVASRVLPWGSVAASRPAVDGCGDRAWAGEWAEAGRQVAKSPPRSSPPRGRPAPPWPSGRGGAAAGGDPVRRLVQPGPRPGPGRRTRRARRHNAGGGQPRAAGIDGCVSTAAGSPSPHRTARRTR